MVRPGNPDGIESWDDLVEPGVEIITPNPGSSGSARWNILAAWAHATGGADDEAAGRTSSPSCSATSIALPGCGREATTAFTDGSGDVLLSYENEAILAKQNGADVDYVVPDDTLLIENPAAVTDGRRTTRPRRSSSSSPAPRPRPTTPSFGFRPVVDGVDDPRGRGRQRPGRPVPGSGHALHHRRQLRWLGRGG